MSVVIAKWLGVCESEALADSKDCPCRDLDGDPEDGDPS